MMQSQYAEPVDLYAPASHGSLTVIRAESALSRCRDNADYECLLARWELIFAAAQNSRYRVLDGPLRGLALCMAS